MVGSRDTYDRLLHQAAAMAKNQVFGLIDRVRLVEILAGPDEALELLEPAAVTP